MYLFYSLADLERDIVPLPDYILVNGSLARDRLVAAGLDSGKLHISGALRYEYLKNVRSHGTTPGSDKVILVIPASGFNETVELITKVLQAFEGSGNLRLIIKLHPTIPADTIMKNFSTLPENFSFSQEPVETLLDRTDLLLFSETAVSIEALARHIPILHIKSDFRIDMNLFEGISFVSSVRTPEEIRVKATELLSPSGTENFAFDETVTAFFAPVDEKIVEIFFHHEQTMD
ncbi:MAG: hypothetical protein Q8S57_08935 [Methanoregula sp.]|nr:hypothetical protein [Methanoregula sp.]